MSKPTPRPWELQVREQYKNPDGFGETYLDEILLLGPVKDDGWQTIIGHVLPKNPDEETARANADLIVKAVNMHDQLIEALREARACLVLGKFVDENRAIAASRVAMAVLAKAKADE